MKKELVAVKPNNTWDIFLDIRLSEGKNLTSTAETISIIKANYQQLQSAEFVVEGIDMYALIDNMTTINPGEECKI